MNFSVDSGKLLYGIGVLLAIAALLYFVRDLVFGLSITVKAALLFAGFLACFVAGAATERDVLDAVAYALAGATYVVFLGYVVVGYELDDTGTFLLLAASAALFVGLGYLVREHDLRVPVRIAGYVGGCLLLVSVALVGADAAGGGVTYDVETVESVSLDPPADAATGDRSVRPVEVRVGTVTATNEFVFRRSLDLPRPSGCLVGADVPRDDVWIGYESSSRDRPSGIDGGESLTFHLEATVPVDANATAPTAYRVERRAACPADADRPTLVVTEERVRVD